MTEKLQPELGSGALREALIKLSNEAGGMLGLSGVREAIGNTNMACLQLRVDEARALLSLSSPIEPAPTVATTLLRKWRDYAEEMRKGKMWIVSAESRDLLKLQVEMAERFIRDLETL